VQILQQGVIKNLDDEEGIAEKEEVCSIFLAWPSHWGMLIFISISTKVNVT
jgi:hypothetical protein